MKKLLLTLVGVICSLGMWAANPTINDLVAIDKNCTFIADDITSNGTAKLTVNTLYFDKHIFALTANTVASNKGDITFGGAKHLNSLRIKNGQDRLAFKVSKACTVTFYTQSHGSRGLYVSKKDNVTADDDAYAKQPASTSVWELELDAAGVYYLTSYGGDFYIAGFVVSGYVTADAKPSISVPATYSGDTKHAIQIKSTVDGSPTPTIQWYSNTTASNTNGTAIEGATAGTYQFEPTEAGTYYFYAVAENKVGKDTTAVTTVTVATAYSVTFSKGSDSEIIGTVPALMYTNASQKVKIPANYSLYVPGKTLTSWTDGTNTYLPGTEYTLSADITLTPNFTANTKTLADVPSETTVKFVSTNSTAVTYQSSTQNAVVEHVTVDGETIDVAMLVKGGKFDLQPSGPRAQTNNGTTMTVPVTKGAKVTIQVYHNVETPTWTGATINGEKISEIEGTTNAKIKTVTYEYTGEEGSIDYVVSDGQYYLYELTVAYPHIETKTASDLAVASATASVNMGESTSVGYTTTSTGNVTAQSDKEGVATVAVNGNNIVITGVAVGTATITVSQDADDTYAAGEKTISVKVLDPAVVYDLVMGVGSQEVGSSNVTLSGEGTTGCIVKFASSLNTTDKKTNYIKITPNAGTFKAGDVISFTGYYNNAAEKEAAITIYKNEVTDENVMLVKSEQFANIHRDYGQTATSQSFTLPTDADALFIGRNGGTTTYIYGELKVTRPETISTPSLNASGYGTFSSAKNVQIVGAKVYKATLDGTTLKCTEIESGKVPAGTGVILYKEGATEASTATALYTESADAIEGNDLKATTAADGSLAAKESALVLSGDTFVTFSGEAFAAGKAYLPYSNSGAKSLTIVFDEGTATAINNVNASTNSAQSAAYNLAGQRVAANAKGIVIMNGKKYINK